MILAAPVLMSSSSIMKGDNASASTVQSASQLASAFKRSSTLQRYRPRPLPDLCPEAETTARRLPSGFEALMTTGMLTSGQMDIISDIRALVRDIDRYKPTRRRPQDNSVWLVLQRRLFRLFPGGDILSLEAFVYSALELFCFQGFEQSYRSILPEHADQVVTDLIRLHDQDWEAEIERIMRGCESEDNAAYITEVVSCALLCVAGAGMRRMLDKLDDLDGPEMDEASRRFYEKVRQMWGFDGHTAEVILEQWEPLERPLKLLWLPEFLNSEWKRVWLQ